MSTNVSSVVSHFPDAENGFTTTTAGSVASGATTVTLNSVAGYTNGEPVVLVIDPTDASKKQTFTGIVDTSGVQITSVVWTAGTNQSHALGATVVDYATATHIAMMSKGIKVNHTQKGNHKTLTDDNANEWIEQGSTGSAVNQIKITNAATGTGPTVSANGDDTNIDLNLSAKGSGMIKPKSFMDGWVYNTLPAVSSVTCNGNRSYDVTFASTVANYLTPGMRIRTTRTVSAPTGAISLNGSSQYANKTSPAGMTFTDDFVVSAWIKLTSYQQGTVVSRYNGTSGWGLFIESDGRITLSGYNGGVGNYSQVKSYQSVPLNKWVHVAAQLDMSSFTATTTTSYVMIDGLDIPAQVLRAGTNPTALVQAGNLEIGTANAGIFFPGNIAQVAIYNAKVTQANIRATISQSLTGAETSLISAYKLDQASGLTDLNTGNANNLTAQGSPTYSTASPFSTDSTGTPGGSYDYAIVQKVSTTTATVQVPEGNTIPTSGGVSAVDLSAWKAPFGMPVQRGKWQLVSLVRTQYAQSSAANGTWYNLGSQQLTIPVGEWVAGYDSPSYMNATSAAVICATLSTGASTANDTEFITETYIGTTITGGGSKTKRRPLSVTAAAPYYLNASPLFGTGTITIYNLDSSTFIPVSLIEAENAYL